MLASLVQSKHVNGALFNLRKLHLGIFDMLIHSPANHQEIVDLNISAAYNRLRREVVKTSGPQVWGQGDEWAHGQSNFAHLMDDYDAGYYEYLR